MAKSITLSSPSKTWHVMVPERAFSSPENYSNYMRIYVCNTAGRMVMNQWLESRRIHETDLYHQDGRPAPELIPSVSQKIKDEFNAAVIEAEASISFPSYEEATSTHNNLRRETHDFSRWEERR